MICAFLIIIPSQTHTCILQCCASIQSIYNKSFRDLADSLTILYIAATLDLVYTLNFAGYNILYGTTLQKLYWHGMCWDSKRTFNYKHVWCRTWHLLYWSNAKNYCYCLIEDRPLYFFFFSLYTLCGVIVNNNDNDNNKIIIIIIMNKNKENV